MSVKKSYIIKILFSVLFLVLSSCAQDKVDPLERETGLTKQDVKDLLLKNLSKEAKQQKQNQAKIQETEAPIPKMSQIVTSPPPPKIGSGKIISFSVTDQVPLKDALIELGRKAEIDIDIDPNITGSIILNAKNRPLSEVIERIAALGNLSYTYKDNILYFEKNTPYLKHYSVDYLVDGSLWAEVLTNIDNIIKIADSNSTSETASVSSASANKSAGIISVYATKTQQQNVEKYLAEVQKNASAQVLIEAKVMEVTLNDEYSSGINWTNFFNANVSQGTGASSAFSFLPSSIEGVTSSPIAIGVASSNLNLNFTATLLERFGIAKAISSPRIHAINNQKATLNFDDKLVYFTVNVTTTDAVKASDGTITTPAKLTVTSTKNEEKTGVLMNIIPSINLKTNEITMNIKPQILVRSGSISDPGTAYAIKQAGLSQDDFSNTIPIIQTRSLETVLKLKSGGILVIGGLLKQDTENVDIGVPFLSEIPMLGNLFKSTKKQNKTVETVIFIKATIVNSNGLVDEPDRKFHEGFSIDNKEFLKQQ